jgi:flagellar hook-basal body complex protein FliE
MSAIGSIPSALQGLPVQQVEKLLPNFKIAPTPPDGAHLVPAAPSTQGFGQMLDGLVSTVSAKETQAADLTKRVLLGESDQLHQSVIAMQEASVAFSLMVEVRNKLVDSYQELMRMQV